MPEYMHKISKPISEIFSEVGIAYAETSSGELLLDKCYNCGRSKKLYVHNESGAFICFRCNEKGGPVKLLSKCINISFKESFKILFGVAAPERVTDDLDDELSVMISGIIKGKSRSTQEKPSEIIRPYYMSDLKETDLEPINYLKSRGLTDDVIKKLKLWHWKQGKRFVFPVVVNGNLLGYLARDYTDKQIPKVLNSKGNFRSFSLWNHDNVIGSETLVICEGAISAIKCGIYRSIALLGKVATSGQIDLIKKLNPKRIVICLDIGTEEEQYKLFQQLCLYFPGRIYSIKFPKIRLVKCACGKKNQVSDGEKDPLCSCGQKLSKQKIESSEYMDAGDYSFEYMDKLISEAKPFTGGPMIWAD